MKAARDIFRREPLFYTQINLKKSGLQCIAAP
jgi:hypothetical protein